jgi:hypothetical protein
MCATTLLRGSDDYTKEQQLNKPFSPSPDDENSGTLQFSFFIVLFMLLLFPSYLPEKKMPTPPPGSPRSVKQLYRHEQDLR